MMKTLSDQQEAHPLLENLTAMRWSKKRATISDVAKLAGVSISTVSRVMNGTAVVAEETTQSVREAVELLNYSPHAAARMLAGQRPAIIGLLLPEIAGAFFFPLVRGIEAAARAQGYELLIHASSQTANHLDSHSMPLSEHNTDGLLVFTDRLDDFDLTRFARRDFPLVVLHRTPPAHLNVPCISFENKDGTQSALDHLVTVHGCRRIAFLGGPLQNEDAQWRLAGYREGLAVHGIEYDPVLVGEGDFRQLQAEEVVEAWLDQGVVFDAILASDDEMAVGAYRALARAGLHVPEDVAVIGFDDVPFAPLLTPALTTVRAPIEAAGRMAAEKLISLIRMQSVEMLTLLPTELIIRASCGCSAA